MKDVPPSDLDIALVDPRREIEGTCYQVFERFPFLHNFERPPVDLVQKCPVSRPAEVDRVKMGLLLRHTVNLANGRRKVVCYSQ
jgi:hypothetical protein